MPINRSVLGASRGSIEDVRSFSRYSLAGVQSPNLPWPTSMLAEAVLKSVFSTGPFHPNYDQLRNSGRRRPDFSWCQFRPQHDARSDWPQWWTCLSLESDQGRFDKKLEIPEQAFKAALSYDKSRFVYSLRTSHQLDCACDLSVKNSIPERQSRLAVSWGINVVILSPKVE